MKTTKKVATAIVGAGIFALSSAGIAAAHVTVKPSDLKTGAFQTFTVGVPNERTTPTTTVKLEIPENLEYVTPTVKPGWTIKTDTHGEGEEKMITAITWTGGQVGVGFRDEFTFSAKVPAQPTEIKWKAYQTYQDGTLVSWDQQPTSEDKEGGTTGPFSVTKVTAETDQDKALKEATNKAQGAQASADTALYTGISSIALALIAVIAIIVRRPKA